MHPDPLPFGSGVGGGSECLLMVSDSDPPPYNVVKYSTCRVPTRTGKTGKPGKMREKFFQSGKSQEILKFYQKVREFCMSQGKVREN